jgi:hypothetical protein
MFIAFASPDFLAPSGAKCDDRNMALLRSANSFYVEVYKHGAPNGARRVS